MKKSIMTGSIHKPGWLEPKYSLLTASIMD
jgi:hypothetical protein